MRFFKQAAYKVGDSVKDVNPTCPHYKAKGKVVGTTKGAVIFIVSNKGKNYKPGDKLTKTVDQMEKTGSNTTAKAFDAYKYMRRSKMTLDEAQQFRYSVENLRKLENAGPPALEALKDKKKLRILLEKGEGKTALAHYKLLKEKNTRN